MRFKKYSEEELREAVRASSSFHQVLLKLNVKMKSGGSYSVLYKAVRYFKIDTSHFLGKSCNRGKRFGPKRPLEQYFSNEHPILSHALKLRMFKEGLKEKKCERCKMSEWFGAPIPLELDHIDGNHFNNAFENLRILCPNCHAQTPTNCGKNKKKKYHDHAN